MDAKAANTKRVKVAIKTLGRKHITLLREALSDKLAVHWFIWERQMLGGKTPLQIIEEGDVAKVRDIVEFCYDFSSLPPNEEEEALDVVDDAELEEAEAEEY